MYLLFPRLYELVVFHRHLARQSLSAMSRRAVGVDGMTPCGINKKGIGVR